MYLNQGSISIAECNKTKRNSPDNSDVIDIAEGLYFAQNLLNIVFWPQSNFFNSIEALLQFVPSFDNLAITALALPMSSTVSPYSVNSTTMLFNLPKILLLQNHLYIWICSRCGAKI